MKSKQKGFTLIELLIVIAIIALMASVVFASLANSRVRSRNARRVADIRQLISGLELYYLANGNYPVQVTPQTITAGISTGIGLLSPTYVARFSPAPTPVDSGCSVATNSYVYTSSDGNSYTLTFCISQVTGTITAGVHTASPNGIQ